MRSCRTKQFTLEQTFVFLIQVKDSENEKDIHYRRGRKGLALPIFVRLFTVTTEQFFFCLSIALLKSNMIVNITKSECVYIA